jgi:hypothetical protein
MTDEAVRILHEKISALRNAKMQILCQIEYISRASDPSVRASEFHGRIVLQNDWSAVVVETCSTV